MIGTIKGKIVSVTGPKIFSVKRKGNRTLPKDYYHLSIDAGKDGFIKVYFPVNSNVTHSSKGSQYSRKGFTKVLNEKTGEWIDYQPSNPRLLLDHVIEATGDVTKSDDGKYYMTRLTSLKVHGKSSAIGKRGKNRSKGSR
jgi:hypothetical protein